MTTREERSARRRQAWHEQRVSAAETPRKVLWAWCGWLVAEAWRSGRLVEATEAVAATVHELREERTR